MHHVDHAARGVTGSARRIGPLGTIGRVGLGGFMFVDVLVGHARGGWHPLAWVLGLLVLPGVMLAWQAARARRTPKPVRATGPVWHALTVAAFGVLYGTNWYAPDLAVLSDAALIFFGASMLLAAARGYAGCEILAISNWVLRRDDQVGCMLFAPVDYVEAAATDKRR